MTRDALKRILSILSVFREVPLASDKFEAYYLVLKDYPEELIERVAVKLLKTFKADYYPKPAHFVELAETDCKTEEEIEEEALLAFAVAEKMIGYEYYSVKFSNPIVHKAIKFGWGNWQSFCNDNESEKAKREKFVMYYKIAVKDKTPPPSFLPNSGNDKGYILEIDIGTARFKTREKEVF